MRARITLSPLRAAFCSMLLPALLLCAPRAQAAPVTEGEALQLAEFWHSAEVNHYYKQGWKRDHENKDKLLYETSISRVRYLVGRDALVDKVRKSQKVLAYVVEFAPRGNVVISADDRFTPLLAFDIDSVFSFEDPPLDPGHNVMRMKLNRYSDAALAYLRRTGSKSAANPIHPSWSGLRSMVAEQSDLLAEEKLYAKDAVIEGDAMLLSGTPDPAVAEVLLPTAVWRMDGPYNDELVREDPPGSPVHLQWVGGGANPPGFPESVPVGCNGVALAILLRYHEWPVVGVGSFTWLDDDPDPKNLVHGGGTVDFGATTYNWANMPTYDINVGDPTAIPPIPAGTNADIAQLMYHTGVMVHSNWEIGGTAGPPNWDEIHYHLRYTDTGYMNAYSNANKPQPNCHHVGVWGYNYFFCPYGKTFLEAKVSCLNAGSDLVIVREQIENDLLTKKMAEYGMAHAWIDASDSGVEGQWSWFSTGEVFWNGDETGAAAFYPTPPPPPLPELPEPPAPYYNSWPGWEPDAQPSTDDCAYLVAQSGFWITHGCNVQPSTIGYICKSPAYSAVLIEKIRDSVVGGLPVFAGTGDEGTGHAIIIDGYRTIIPPEEAGYLHINPGFANDDGTNMWVTAHTMPYNPLGNDDILVEAWPHPTPVNYYYVDGFYGGNGDGSLEWPFRYIVDGVIHMTAAHPQTNPKGGRLWIKAGSYTGLGNFPLTVSTPMEIASYAGDVLIGGKLRLKSSGSLRMPFNSGVLRVR